MDKQIDNMFLIEQVNNWLEAKEGESFEFKEARNQYSFDKLAEYCCALANEGGGRIILGATDKRPRKIVGTRAFPQPEDTRRSLIEKLHIGIDFDEVAHPDGRVLIFHIPSRPIGIAIQLNGIYWSRMADSLAPISPEKLRKIFDESGHDFSADICIGAKIDDLDPQAIEEFRRRWIEKSKNNSLLSLSKEQLLLDAELISKDGITNAALILFGKQQALSIYLAQAEVIFEYRSSDVSGPAQQRKTYRQGFFSFYDDLWNTINLRNDLQHYQEGLFILDIPTFEERSIREAILNAVSHRNYQLSGSVFIRQYPRRLVVESPGGFPVGINIGNILYRQAARNRRIAEAFEKCGLVERSGQGMNLMFELSIQHGKSRPDFSGTDDYNVVITLHGEVRDPKFAQFLERIGQETNILFSTDDFLILDLIHREEKIPSDIKERIPNLIEVGAIERIGRGRDVRYILSRRFYTIAKKKGAYTRKKGLDRETNKQLLLKHINDNAKEGSRLKDLRQVLPELSPSQIQVLLRELKKEEKIISKGHTKAGLWYPLIKQINDYNQKE